MFLIHNKNFNKNSLFKKVNSNVVINKIVEKWTKSKLNLPPELQLYQRSNYKNLSNQ